MQAVAHLRNLRMSPRKVRLVADLVRGVDAVVADAQLAHLPKAASHPIRKLLASAVANAVHNAGLAKDNLYVAQIAVNQGPTLKRSRARAFGRAAAIRKRSCHVTLVLDERVPTSPVAVVKPAHASVAPPVVMVDRPKVALGGHGHAHPEDTDAKGTTEGEPEITDTRRQGKHRHKQHEDARSGKHPGGFFKKLFNRRSGER